MNARDIIKLAAQLYVYDAMASAKKIKENYEV